MVSILRTKCRLRHEQVKTKRSKISHSVQCDRCIFYGTEQCVDYKRRTTNDGASETGDY